MKLTPINPHFNACDQKWELMPEKDGGRLCGECQKVLIDFRGLTEQEVLNKQKANNFTLCGSYKQSQVDRLHRYLTLEESQNQRPWLVSLAMGVGSLLPFGATAQNEPIADTVVLDKVEVSHYKTPRQERFIVGEIPVTTREIYAEELRDSIKTAIAPTVPLPGLPSGLRYPLLNAERAKDSLYISGTVRDQYSGETLPAAIVSFAELSIHTETDIKGNFTIKLPIDSSITSYTLQASYFGYEKLTLTISTTNHTQIKDVALVPLGLEIVECRRDERLMGEMVLGVSIVTHYPKPTRWLNPANWYRYVRYKLRRR